MTGAFMALLGLMVSQALFGLGAASYLLGFAVVGGGAVLAWGAVGSSTPGGELTGPRRSSAMGTNAAP